MTEISNSNKTTKNRAPPKNGQTQKAKQKKDRTLKTNWAPNRNRNRGGQFCREQTGAEAGEEQLRVEETGGASLLGSSSPPQSLMGSSGHFAHCAGFGAGPAPHDLRPRTVDYSRAPRYAESKLEARD